jgi:hypothetical protein
MVTQQSAWEKTQAQQQQQQMMLHGEVAKEQHR